jgi:hypothetical protein
MRNAVAVARSSSCMHCFLFWYLSLVDVSAVRCKNSETRVNSEFCKPSGCVRENQKLLAGAGLLIRRHKQRNQESVQIPGFYNQ